MRVHLKYGKNVFGNFADEYKSDASFPECSTVINSPYCAETGLIASKNCPVGGNGYYKSTNCKVCDNSHKQKNKIHLYQQIPQNISKKL